MRKILVILIIMTAIGTCHASVPATMSYQGKLMNSSGQPVADGVYSMRFYIFGQATNGTVLWQQPANGQPAEQVQVTGGLFNVMLGSAVPLSESAFQGSTWLQTEVNGTTLAPRVQIVSTGYAIRAKIAETVPDGSVGNLKISDLAWSKLTGVPAGLSDGDNDTTYSQGTGLTLTGTTFSLNSAYTDGLYWKLGGNAGTNPASNYIGTTDNQPLDLRANGERGIRLRWDYRPLFNLIGMSVIGGSRENVILDGVVGGTIAGGGDRSDYGTHGNTVTDNFGTIGGGSSNQAGDALTDTGNAAYATVAGGAVNFATAYNSAVGGGSYNTAGGQNSTIPGGSQNATQGWCSLAAGYRAKANHDGSFAWSDIAGGDFATTAQNQFLIRAAGGVGIGANDPQAPLDVNGVIRSRSGGFEFPNGTVQTTALTDGSVTTERLANGAVTDAKVSDVAWTKLTGVPASLADGDNDTTYSNGTGLSLTGTAFSLDTTYTDGRYWKLGGNSGTTPGTNFLGTTDNQPLEFRVNNGPALRLRPDLVYVQGSPVRGTSVSCGYMSNMVLDGVVGGTIAGGGYMDTRGLNRNTVTDDLGTIGGGSDNRAGDSAGTTSDHWHATVAGGQRNTASGAYSAVPGGANNVAKGGYSFAAGRAASADHDGTFVWADGTGAGLTSTAANQFLIRAAGGVGIGTESPSSQLSVAGNADVSGNLGIGTTSPQQALSVNGSMNVDQAGVNYGGVLPGITFGSNSGEGIASRRTSGGNAGGIDLFTNWTSRLSVSNSGNVGIGTVSPSYKLHVNGSAAKPGGGSWTDSSDRRLKQNIEPLMGSLDRLLGLQGVTYEWIHPEEHGNFTGPQIGMIAQDVEKVFPGWIGEDGKGYKTLTFRGFEALAVEALREQQNQIQAQQKVIEELTARLAALEAKAAKD